TRLQGDWSSDVCSSDLVWQQLEEFQKIRKAGDAVVFAAHDQGRRANFRGIANRQIGAHIDIGAGRHRVVECQDRVGKGFNDGVKIGRASCRERVKVSVD